MQRDIPVPEALVQLSHRFDSSIMGEHRAKTRPGPVRGMCFRILNLRSAIKGGDITDSETIFRAATDMNREFNAWETNLKSLWSYDSINDGNTTTGSYEGKRHIYRDLQLAQIWNNWRTLRILVHQFILHDMDQTCALYTAHAPAALSLVHQMATEICVSVASFAGSSRKASPSAVLGKLLMSPKLVFP
jgi:hypothetical protein